MRILIASLIAALPLQAAADVDCTVIDALERIQFAQQRLAYAPQFAANAPDVQLVIGEVSRLDSSKVTFASQSTLSTADQARLVGFFEQAASLRRMLMVADWGQTRNIMRTNAFAQHQANAKRILPLFKCNEISGLRGIDGRERATSSIKGANPSKKITIISSGLWLAAIVALGVAVKFTKTALAARQLHQRRRSKRYRVHIVTQVRRHGVLNGGTILDISCNGVKIQTDLTTENATGEHVEIWLGKTWKPAQISWSNAHYIGLRFTHALAHEYVVSLNKSEQKSLRKRKNGAQLGAAFDS